MVTGVYDRTNGALRVNVVSAMSSTALRAYDATGVLNAAVVGGVKTLLSADTTFYVRTDGSDSNDGSANDAAHAFLTILAAWRYVCRNFSFTGYTVTIQLSAGTFAGISTWADRIEPGPDGVIYIRGNPDDVTATSVTDNGGGSGVFAFGGPEGATVFINGVTIVGTGLASVGVYASYGTNNIVLGTDPDFLEAGAVKFSGRFNFAVRATWSSGIELYNAITVAPTGTWNFFSLCDDRGLVFLSCQITMSSALTVNTCFAYFSQLAELFLNGNFTATGTVTGKKYSGVINAIMRSGGLTLPGTVAGTTASGAQVA